MKRHITLCYMIDRTHSTDADIDKFSRVAHHKVKPVDGVVKLNMFVNALMISMQRPIFQTTYINTIPLSLWQVALVGDEILLN